MSYCTNANAWGIIKTDALAQCDIETLRRIALKKSTSFPMRTALILCLI